MAACRKVPDAHFYLVLQLQQLAYLLGPCFGGNEKFEESSLDNVVVPKNWKQIGEVGELIMYPLKGGKRKCVTETEFTKIGLREMDSGKVALRDR